jgi:two-component system phosphate regulon sensor histidine kinase PhoR
MPRFLGRHRRRTLRGRLLLWHGIAILGVLIALGVVLDRVLERSFVDQLTDSLVSDARAVQEILPPTMPTQSDVIRLGRAMGVRITVIRSDGVVLADSEHDPASMGNHLTRPEVEQALSGRTGLSSRTSSTIGIPFRYVALPPKDGRIVRVALPLTAVNRKLDSVRLILGVGFALAALAGLLVLAAIARGVSRPLQDMAGSVARLGEGDFTGEVPEGGTEELNTLGRTLNRMREELATRMEAMEKDRRTLDAILSSLEEGVALLGRDGTALYQNPSAVRMLGRSLEQARNLAPATLNRVISQARDGGAPATGEFVSADSVPRTLLATAAAVPGDANILLVIRDVTQARRLEAVRRDFVANASHELKTPAASIQALAETIASAASDDPAAVHRFAPQLEHEAGRLARMISDLLDLSRLEGEPGEFDEVRFDRLVAEEAERYRTRAEQAGLAVGIDAGQPVSMSGSARDLALMVGNLMENAIQYTRQGGRIDVKVSRRDDRTILEVRDTGIGVPSRDQRRVFERFYRVDRARSRETGGTGLGLSIVKHVAENHGGTVEVQSELGVGSLFRVTVPSTPTST